MKRLSLLVVVLAATYFAQAQISFGVHGNVIGASMQNKADDPNNDISDFKTRISWKLGLVAQVPLTTNLSFMPQLNVLSKGGKIDETQTGEVLGAPITVTAKGDAKLTYVELPLNVVYSTGGEEGGFFIGIGPVISYGIGGKTTGNATGTYQGQTYTRSLDGDVKFDGKKTDELDPNDENTHFKALEFGANVLVGYQLMNGVFINAHYNYGISNIDPNAGYESRNRYFGVGIGYFFNRQSGSY